MIAINELNCDPQSHDLTFGAKGDQNSMSRRGKNQVTFSLFAFQDIITSVTGIMILVTLFLALELLQRVDSSPSGRTRQIIESIQSSEATVDDLEASVARNEARIEELTGRLLQGASRIGEVASFDSRAVEEDTSNMEQINDQLAKELEVLAKQVTETARRKSEAEARREQLNPEEIRKRVDDVERKREELERLKRSKRVIFNPTEGDAKVPWLVEITSDGLAVARTGAGAQPTRLADVNALQDWAQRLNRDQDYFVLLVTSDGIERYHKAKDVLQQMGFDLGFDLLGPQQTAIDLEAETGTP